MIRFYFCEFLDDSRVIDIKTSEAPQSDCGLFWLASLDQVSRSFGKE